MQKLKIAMFMDSWYPDINGVIVVMDNLMKQMKDYAEVTLVVPKNGSEKDDKNYFVNIIRVNSVPLFKTGYRLGTVDVEYLKYKKLFKKYDFDIIHIHSPFALGRLGIRVAKDKNIPVIATMHTRWEFEFKKRVKSNLITNIIIRHLIKSYNNCDSCIALNNALIKVYKDYGYKGKIQIIHNGTDLTMVKDKDKTIKKINKMFNIKDGEIVFLFVGRIISIKNIFFILDVLKELKERKLKYKMIYVGDGPDFNALSKKIKDYNMTDEVVMAGKIMDRDLLKEIYYRADLFIFPSLFDSSSLVQIEAASQETPTIFVEGSVTSDTVDNNVTGFKEKEDVNAFADRIESILKDKKLNDKVRKTARKELAKTWDVIAKETYEYYQKVIEEHNKD